MTHYFSPKFVDLRFAEFTVFADRPSLARSLPHVGEGLLIGPNFGSCTVMFSPIIYVHKRGKFVKHIENVKELFLMVYT